MATITPSEIDRREDEIRRRAYELYVQNGFSGDSELEDWLEAERDVVQEKLAQLEES